MRERLARFVAIVTVAGLVGLSTAFARAQNPAPAPQPEEASPAAAPVAQAAAPGDTLRARVLFDELGCTACHSVGELGNPRNPLDGVGSRRTAPSLRAWTLGEEAVADSLPPGALRVKTTYLDVPEADLDLLLAWLAGLKADDGGDSPAPSP